MWLNELEESCILLDARVFQAPLTFVTFWNSSDHGQIVKSMHRR